MAQDATGTPTAKGIPKFNTAVDAPSGKGFNAGMDAIDTLLDSYAAKPSGIVSGEVPVWNGSAWVRSSVTRIGVGSLGSGSPSSSNFLRGDGTWASAGAPTYQTTLPGSPVDGQQTIFVDSTSAPTYAWYLRYNSTLAKWQYIGGLPKVARVNTYESTTSTTYADLTTDGPTFTIPLSGDYDIYFGAAMENNTNGAATIAGLMVNGSQLQYIRADSLNAFAEGGGAWTYCLSAATASWVAKLQYKVADGGSGSGTGSYYDRHIIVSPRTVS
jgi:hypothetical protein